MEAKEIVLHASVISFLEELTTTLYQEAYFGFLETAELYVNNLIDGIYGLLSGEGLYHTTPDALKHYGSYYTKIKSNKRTTWYVFFDKRGYRYYVQYITNNHTAQSAFLNRL